MSSIRTYLSYLPAKHLYVALGVILSVTSVVATLSYASAQNAVTESENATLEAIEERVQVVEEEQITNVTSATESSTASQTASSRTVVSSNSAAVQAPTHTTRPQSVVPPANTPAQTTVSTPQNWIEEAKKWFKDAQKKEYRIFQDKALYTHTYNIPATRGESAAALVYILDIELTSRQLQKPSEFKTPFTDTDDFDVSAFMLHTKGITSGCEVDRNGNLKFCEDRKITRGEFSVWLERAIKQEGGPHYRKLRQTQFPDVKGHRYEKSITYLEMSGIALGKDDGKFYPDENISLQQIMWLLERSARYTN